MILDFYHNSKKNVCIQVRTNVQGLTNPFDGQLMFIILTHRHFNSWIIESNVQNEATEAFPDDEASCKDDDDDLFNLAGLEWPIDNVDFLDLESLNI